MRAPRHGEVRPRHGEVRADASLEPPNQRLMGAIFNEWTVTIAQTAYLLLIAIRGFKYRRPSPGYLAVAVPLLAFWLYGTVLRVEHRLPPANGPLAGPFFIIMLLAYAGLAVMLIRNAIQWDKVARGNGHNVTLIWISTFIIGIVVIAGFSVFEAMR